MALLSGNVVKYKLLTGENVLPEKGLLETAAAIKKSEYLPLRSELKSALTLQKKQHQGLGKAHEFDKEGDELMNKNDKKPTLKKSNKSNT